MASRTTAADPASLTYRTLGKPRRLVERLHRERGSLPVTTTTSGRTFRRRADRRRPDRANGGVSEIRSGDGTSDRSSREQPVASPVTERHAVARQHRHFWPLASSAEARWCVLTSEPPTYGRWFLPTNSTRSGRTVPGVVPPLVRAPLRGPNHVGPPRRAASAPAAPVRSWPHARPTRSRPRPAPAPPARTSRATSVPGRACEPRPPRLLDRWAGRVWPVARRRSRDRCRRRPARRRAHRMPSTRRASGANSGTSSIPQQHRDVEASYPPRDVLVRNRADQSNPFPAGHLRLQLFRRGPVPTRYRTARGSSSWSRSANRRQQLKPVEWPKPPIHRSGTRQPSGGPRGAPRPAGRD